MRLEKLNKDCCGCTACAAVCPKKAIEMRPDEEGFLYPHIREELCVDCGRCVKVCAFHDQGKKTDGEQHSRTYAVIHKDPHVLKSSRSGGIFYALARHLLSHGGVVYGVALDEALCARTVRIDKEDALPLLQGSKYVQSDKGGSFSLVAKDLRKSRTVLFSGTACEVSGLLSYLCESNVSIETLYTCDLICHGTPSPKVWQDNLALMEKKLGGRPDRVSFRDKAFGWAPHIESYTRGSKTKYANRYTSVFYGDAALRPACSTCPFAKPERCADLTLADFWGIEALSLPIDPSLGVSCLMTHTEKAEALLREVTEEVECIPVETELLRQPNLRSPTPASPQREAFWRDYHRKGYRYASRRFYGPKERLKLIYNYAIRRKKS